MKVSKEEANPYLLAFMDTIITSLGKDKRVVGQCFGSFRIKDDEERVGKEPISGEPALIPKRSKHVFQPRKELPEMVNRKRLKPEPFANCNLTQARVLAQM